MSTVTNANAINCSEAAAAYIRTAIPRRLIAVQECFAVALLDTQLKPIGKPYLVAIGTVNRCEVTLRDVYREAVKRNATSIVVLHNHPSGKLDPSDDDTSLVKCLTEAGELLGITLLDSIIIGANGAYISMQDKGIMK